MVGILNTWTIWREIKGLWEKCHFANFFLIFFFNHVSETQMLKLAHLLPGCSLKAFHDSCWTIGSSRGYMSYIWLFVTLRGQEVVTTLEGHLLLWWGILAPSEKLSKRWEGRGQSQYSGNRECSANHRCVYTASILESLFRMERRP